MERSLAISIAAAAALGLAVLGGATEADAAFCATNLRSQNSNVPFKVTFLNKSGEFRGVMWIDFRGQPVPYANLNPGQSFTVDTFVTHPWMFTDGPGNCVEMFLSKKPVAKYTITLKASGAGGD